MIIDRISRELGLDPNRVWNIVNSANHLYKFYTLKKRDGGLRHIYHPAKRLKAVQKWTAQRIFAQLPVHASATAYIKGKSISDNALPHTSSNFVQKMDFSNFFESIKSEDILRLLYPFTDELRLSDQDAQTLCRIVCRYDRLTIGAPSSPVISNAMLYEFDCAVSDFADQHGIAYTRYADDLTFSCKSKNTVGQSVQFVRDLIEEIPYPNLKINEQKLVSVSKKRKRTVTGLVLTTDGKVSIGRSRKREIRALIHKYGTGELELERVDYLRGLLAFLYSVEPDAVTSLKAKYGKPIISELMDHAEPKAKLYRD
ncbi:MULTISPECIES: retron St85 family RNA-directed DNA polymerase [Kordiimonas]|jgi:retron-type reverse transcriptase|uniref:retron St85 family RNA-directed DNA polymerase n=1 Tax=Kordiimonas TaxID=288021 RepID=UPI002579F6D5|nr:retron St85 family RNA-directed DNA polymerase [Kordiimonas sp. UBA4487]